MSERWQPQQRKFCKFCSCWFADNKISVDNHEKGATHQANVEKELNRTRQNKQDLAAAERILAAQLQKIEAAAFRSLEEDAKINDFYKENLERERLKQANGKTGPGPSYR